MNIHFKLDSQNSEASIFNHEGTIRGLYRNYFFLNQITYLHWMSKRFHYRVRNRQEVISSAFRAKKWTGDSPSCSPRINSLYFFSRSQWYLLICSLGTGGRVNKIIVLAFFESRSRSSFRSSCIFSKVVPRSKSLVPIMSTIFSETAPKPVSTLCSKFSIFWPLTHRPRTETVKNQRDQWH